MAHEYTAEVIWTRDGAVFTDNRYSRGHVWRFDGGVEVPASSSPLSVKLPLSRADAGGRELPHAVLPGVRGESRVRRGQIRGRPGGRHDQERAGKTVCVKDYAQPGHFLQRSKATVAGGARRAASPFARGVLRRQ